MEVLGWFFTPYMVKTSSENNSNRSRRSFFANWRKFPLCDKRERTLRVGNCVVSLSASERDANASMQRADDGCCVCARVEGKLKLSRKSAANLMWESFRWNFLCFSVLCPEILHQKFLFFVCVGDKILIDFCVPSLCAGRPGESQKKNNLSQQLRRQEQKKDTIYKRSKSSIKTFRVDAAMFLVKD